MKEKEILADYIIINTQNNILLSKFDIDFLDLVDFREYHDVETKKGVSVDSYKRYIDRTIKHTLIKQPLTMLKELKLQCS
ncbi:MAG: hypothetical protein DRG78_00590 [Epsilonproteobacteria bacterium]|nr:MAG: hypothetical protein DRG78_00590 [Campylobacterota bacterium]